MLVQGNETTKRTDLVRWVEQLDKARVLVVGDVLLDRFVYGTVTRISPEAPVPVLMSVETKSTAGGAGNVVRNLQAVGSRVHFVSIVGGDPEGIEIRSILSGFEGIESTVLVDHSRSSPLKIRFIADQQQVLRVDREMTVPINPPFRKKAFNIIKSYIDICDVLILSDYAKGLLCPDLLKRVINAANKSGKPVFVDPKGKDYTRYRGATVLTPNMKELGEATRLRVTTDEGIVIAAKKLISICRLQGVLVTRSQEGMTLVQANGEVIHLPAKAKEVFDVSGAGDTVIAVTAAAFGAGAPLSEAAGLANIAAGIAVGKVGTAVIYPKDLLQAFYHQELSTAEAKILDVQSAADRVELWRRKRYTIGFTDGVFDFLTPAHLKLLSEAGKKCDKLIVAIHSDSSVCRLTGSDPEQHESARSAILASLEVVDMVTINHDETPAALIEKLRPDVLIKETNGNGEEVAGAEIVNRYGGRIHCAGTCEATPDPALPGGRPAMTGEREEGCHDGHRGNGH